MSKIIKYQKFNPDARKVEESNFSIANGYLGMRASFEEGTDSKIPSIEGTYLNAFYDLFDIQYAAKYTGYPDLYQRMMPIVNIQNIEIYIDNKRYLFDGKKIKNYLYELDMSSGEVRRSYLLELNDGETIEFSFKKLLSQINYDLFIQNFDFNFKFKKAKQIKIKFPMIFKELTLDKGVPNDPRANLAGQKVFELENLKIEKEVGSITYKTLRSKQYFQYSTKILGLKDFKVSGNNEEIIFEKTITNEKINIYKLSSVNEQNFRKINQENSLKIINDYAKKTYQDYVSENFEYFKDFWSRADSHFGEANQDLLAPNNFNMFQLYTNIGKLPWTNVAAKGLTGEGYAGHYFWDSEIYIITALTLFDSKLAKLMLMFRYNTLQQARERAKIMAHPKGALYPWRTINGEETSTYYPAGTAQYHINGDIAFTIINYFKATKDYEFLYNYGFDILIETARLWSDKVVVYDGVAHINGVTGPDEYQIIVNDDYWTNSVAKFNLSWAKKVCDMLKKDDKDLFANKIAELKVDDNELNEFESLSEKIILPYDKKNDLNPQHDNFLKRKPVDKKYINKYKPFLRTLHPLSINTLRVTKQADVVLANLFFPYENNVKTMSNNWHFYDATDTADSSLSKCIYAIMAARLRLEDYGFEYFKESIYLDLFDTHKNTDRGLHMANMGGARMFVIYGLLGINIELDSLEINPCWNDIINDYDVKLEYQGALLDFAFKNKKLKITNLNKVPVTIKNKNKLHQLTESLIFEYE